MKTTEEKLAQRHFQVSETVQSIGDNVLKQIVTVRPPARFYKFLWKHSIFRSIYCYFALIGFKRSLKRQGFNTIAHCVQNRLHWKGGCFTIHVAYARP